MSYKKFFDLTYEIHEGMLKFDVPWHPDVSIQILGRQEKEGRTTRRLTIGTHSGTHVDAPFHFIAGGQTIEHIPLRKLTGPVSIINFSHLKENAVVDEEMLKKIMVTKRMIFKFGWGKYWGSSKFYKGYPFFKKEAAEYLIKQGVEMVAMDTPSPDDSRINLKGKNLGSDIDSPIHKIFLRAGLVLVEYLANLDELNDYKNWNIVVAPLKIRAADGSPARVFLYK